MSKILYENCQKKNLKFSHVMEVGVYYPETSNVLGFIRDNVKTSLVEADPLCVEKIRKHFQDRKNIIIFPCAVWEKEEAVEMFRAKASTFIGSISASPALVNDGYVANDKDRFVANGRPFNAIDDGTIDLLSIDIEGAEWCVIKNMVSRPRVIALEMQAGTYINPKIGEIKNWMRRSGYTVWFLDDTDCVYVKRGSVSFTLVERLVLAKNNFLTTFNHMQQRVKRRFRKNRARK
jgi:FkbM family methyltransferase